VTRTGPPLDGRILVTGASSGIGLAMARRLAAGARSLILTARRSERLQALADELRAGHPTLQVLVLPCDLSSPQAVEELAGQAAASGPVDVLINSAGVGDLELFERAGWEKLHQVMQLNVHALTRLTHRLLPGMLARGRGGILNVSSGMGLLFLPGMAVYSGAKHYVTAFSEALRLELRGTGVVVSQLCSGPVRTEFLAVAGNPFGRLPGLMEISAERCARIALRGFARGRPLIIPGLHMKLLLGLARLSPRWLQRLCYGWRGRGLRRRAPSPQPGPPRQQD
jgi:short-subunit dehydrogenase